MQDLQSQLAAIKIADKQQPQAEAALKSISFKELVRNKVITGASALRVNESGYPYLTLLRGSMASNVYFGKNSAAIILAKYKVGDIVNTELTKSDIVLTVNTDGEERFKISLSENTKYTSGSRLLEAFELEEEITDGNFDVLGFANTFEGKPTPEELEAQAALMKAAAAKAAKLAAKK